MIADNYEKYLRVACRLKRTAGPPAGDHLVRLRGGSARRNQTATAVRFRKLRHLSSGNAAMVMISSWLATNAISQ